jgi:L-lactate dehydrogenase (cytochrome)
MDLTFPRVRPILFANVAGLGVGDGRDAIALADYAARQFDPDLSWDDVEWLRGRWQGPIVFKGIQTAEDARTDSATPVDPRRAGVSQG